MNKTVEIDRQEFSKLAAIFWENGIKEDMTELPEFSVCQFICDDKVLIQSTYYKGLAPRYEKVQDNVEEFLRCHKNHKTV